MTTDALVFNLILDYKNVGNWDDFMDLMQSIDELIHNAYVKDSVLAASVSYTDWEVKSHDN